MLGGDKLDNTLLTWDKGKVKIHVTRTNFWLPMRRCAKGLSQLDHCTSIIKSKLNNLLNHLPFNIRHSVGGVILSQRAVTLWSNPIQVLTLPFKFSNPLFFFLNCPMVRFRGRISSYWNVFHKRINLPCPWVKKRKFYMPFKLERTVSKTWPTRNVSTVS